MMPVVFAGALLGAWVGYRLATRSAQADGVRSRGLSVFAAAIGGGIIGAGVMGLMASARGGSVTWSESVQQVTTQAELDAVVEAAGSEPVLVDFYATWCPPCKAMAPHVDALAESGKVRVAAVDTDKATDLAQAFGVTSLPTLVVLVGGEEVRRELGYHDIKELHAFATGE